MGTCRCCGQKARLVGVYCSKCMHAFKKERARDREVRAYYRALEFGAGDLWRLG